MKQITLKSGHTQTLLTESELQPNKMYVKIKDIAYIYASNERDAFKEMTGYYLEVETEHLFNNQYNTEALRIMDNMVERVVGDVRSKWCKNKYTGAMVLVGDEEKYIAEQKKKEYKACDGCFWNRKVTTKTHVSEDENKKVTTELFGMKCTYKDDSGDGCVHSTTIRYGFEYFTPQNTFFLKYPNGIKKVEVSQELKEGIVIGTYTLEYLTGLEYLRIRNSRKTIDFEYDKESKRFRIIKGMYVKGYHTSTLDVPEKVNEQVKKELEKHLK